MIALLAGLLSIASPARAVQGYLYGPSISTVTGTAQMNMAGVYNIAAASATLSTPTVVLDGRNGSIRASTITVNSFNVIYGVTAATANFTSISTFSIQTSSGIKIGGGIYAAFLAVPVSSAPQNVSGSMYGDGTSNAPLGVRASSVPIYSTGQNLVLPYGISAASGSITNLTATLSGNSSVLNSATFTINANAITNISEVWIASANFVQTATQSFTLTNLGVQISSTLFRFHYDCWSASQSFVVLSYNNDKGGNYFYSISGVNALAFSTINQGLSHGASLSLGAMHPRSTFHGDVFFSVAYSSSATTVDYSTIRVAQTQVTQGFPTPVTLTGNYNGASPLTSIQISESITGPPTNATTPDNTATANCHLELYKGSSWP